MSMTQYAPGWPGIEPRWTSSAKTCVGTALHARSRLWFTASHGIVNEVYYPRLDRACLRDLGLIVTDGDAFFSEEKRDAISTSAWLAPGVPAFNFVNMCREGRYSIQKEILTDPQRDVLLQKVIFRPLSGTLADYHLYVLLAPHLANHGWGNTAWMGEHKGVPMLFAERDGTALAVACTPEWLQGSAGFAGVSDGWQDLAAHRQMSWNYDRAENGNVALTGEVDLCATGGLFVVALAFGSSPTEAGHRARASLLDGFEHARQTFIDEWTVWQARMETRGGAPQSVHRGRMSAAVLRCHEEKRIRGGIIASLSIPWGDDKSDEDLGGYHLVWPRDLVESAGGLLSTGALEDAERVLGYLRATQEADGSWPQNMWVDGAPYWHGIQLDETALPVLLVDLIRRDERVDLRTITGFWPMVRRAAGFVVRNGPGTPQDRWEEQAGLAPFTVAAEVAALIVAADLAEENGEPTLASYLRETADWWNECIESWIYVQGTRLAEQVGVDGYYVRIAPLEVADAASPKRGFVPIKNRPWPRPNAESCEIVSPDALALVRFGLRSPDDPRILNTIRVIDALLKVEMPFGPVWRRYNGDRYGEHDGGAPFDGNGVGRPWPLLTGERAHYEIAAGHLDEAERLLATYEACAGEGGLLPEQLWDGPDIPERELSFGRPSGSARPLVWAHAEHLKLQRSLRDRRVYDLPPQTWERYVRDKTRSRYAGWRFNHQIKTFEEGRRLRLETLVPCSVHWSADAWGTTSDATARDTGLGEWMVDLPTDSLSSGTRIDFTFYWTEVDRWERRDFHITITPIVTK